MLARKSANTIFATPLGILEILVSLTGLPNPSQMGSITEFNKGNIMMPSVEELSEKDRQKLEVA